MQKNVLKYIFLILFLGILIFASSFYEDSSEKIERTMLHFLDVGQGDSALIELPNKIQIMIDAGPDRGVLEEVGNIMPYYDRKIEYLIISHPHADHFAGFSYILDTYQVEKIYLNGYENNTPDYQVFKQKTKEKNIQVEILQRGDVIDFGDVKIDVLWPERGGVALTEINETSLIFNLRKGDDTVFFTGDASSSTQELLSKNLKSIDVLKVSHHGSKTGTTDELNNKLKPKYSIISAGKDNAFNHPAQNILDLLRKSTILRTDEIGTISFELTGAGVILE